MLGVESQWGHLDLGLGSSYYMLGHPKGKKPQNFLQYTSHIFTYFLEYFGWYSTLDMSSFFKCHGLCRRHLPGASQRWGSRSRRSRRIHLWWSDRWLGYAGPIRLRPYFTSPLPALRHRLALRPFVLWMEGNIPFVLVAYLLVRVWYIPAFPFGPFVFRNLFLDRPVLCT